MNNAGWAEVKQEDITAQYLKKNATPPTPN